MMELIEKKPKVSVCVVTYNQEKYIRQCLQSIVDQETDFDFEVIVGDDCSTDGTRMIVQEFVDKYPGMVKPIFQPTNIGATKNYLAVHGAAMGDYIAHVDGDDYALPGKLAALAHVLDTRPEVNVAWHRLRILDEETGKLVDDLIDVRLQPEGGFTRRDLLACGSMGYHSAKMYRSHLRGLMDFSLDEMMDFYLTVEHVADGRAVWIEGFYGVYRRNVGVLTASDLKYKRLFKEHLLFFLNKYKDCRKEINSLAILLLLADIKNFRNTLAFELWLRSFHLLSAFEFVKRLPLHRILRLPPKE